MHDLDAAEIRDNRLRRLHDYWLAQHVGTRPAAPSWTRWTSATQSAWSPWSTSSAGRSGSGSGWWRRR